MPRRSAWILCLALALSWASPGAGAALPTVALDLSALTEEQFGRVDAVALERLALTRLVQDGFAVVALPSAPRVVVRYTLSGQTLVIAAFAAGQPVAERRVALAGEPLPELHLEAAQRSVDVAREAVSLARTDPEPAPSPPLDSAPPLVDAPPPGLQAPIGVELSLGGEALWRPAPPAVGGALPVDPQLRLALRVGRALGLALRLELTFALASSGSVQALEGTAQLGLGLRFALGPRLSLEVALTGGAGLHSYRVSVSEVATRDGLRAYGVASLPLTLGWEVGPLILSARVAAGVGLVDLEHRLVRGVVEETLWRRGPLRLEAGPAVAWKFQ